MLLHLLPKFAVCAVPSMVSFGSWSFSWPISGSSRDNLEPWDITKHLGHAILKPASGQGRLKSRTWKQRTSVDNSCIFVAEHCLQLAFYGNHLKLKPFKRSEQQKSGVFHRCICVWVIFFSEARHKDNSGFWILWALKTWDCPPIRWTHHLFICSDVLGSASCFVDLQTSLAACEKWREENPSTLLHICVRRNWIISIIQKCAVTML